MVHRRSSIAVYIYTHKKGYGGGGGGDTLRVVADIIFIRICISKGLHTQHGRYRAYTYTRAVCDYDVCAQGLRI